MILSVLLPGLGHFYMGKLGRALVWLAGTLALALVVNQDGADPAVAGVMIVALAVLAAADIAIVIRVESAGRGRL